ncbi:MAG TPA: hypothetical protein VGO24_09755 [Solirubrobacterales bacterium]|jgi:hypothetical protein|nr:hypothetical protein [Solirubrobacterales bacterium]
MAVAAPKRRSSVVPAPAPARTTAPERSQPRTTRRPAAKPTSRAGAAAPARAPARRVPARAPQRARPKRSTGGQPSLAIAVGRTAATVRHLPDSGLIVRMTRGRTWIAVLGVLLVGIVALNVVTLSFAATAGKVDGQITELEKENSMLRSRVGEKSGIGRVRSGASEQGLVMPNKSAPQMIEYGPGDLSTAAQRLAAAG